MTTTDTAATPEAGLAPQGNKRWYVVHAYSGMEKSVMRALTERVLRADMQDKFGRILVPTEEVVEIKNGHKAITERRFFPGYVLVEMEMTDETWHLVKNTNKVTGFDGGKAGPSQAENGHFTTSHGGDRRHQILNPAKITARRATNAPIFFTFA